MKVSAPASSTASSIPEITVANGTTDATTKNITFSGQATMGTGDANTIVGGGTSAAKNIITGANNYRTIVGSYDSTIGSSIASTIIGCAHGSISDGTTHCSIVGGSYGSITAGDYGAISGGTGHTVSASEAVISGGINNTVSGRYANVNGGSTNSATSQGSTVSGGINNSVGATANNASVGGGNDCDIINAGSARIGGGDQNKVGHASFSASYSSLLGGLSNLIGQTAQSQYSSILGGRSNTVIADYGSVLGGRGNTSATYGLASGYGALTRLAYQRAHGGEAFTVQGDFQETAYMLKRQTTNATPTEMRIGAATARLTIPTESTWTFHGLVAARRTDGGAEQSAGYLISGCIKNDAGTVALVGTPTVTVLGEDDAAWTVAVTADNTNDALSITVTGAAAVSINWGCTLRVMELVA